MRGEKMSDGNVRLTMSAKVVTNVMIARTTKLVPPAKSRWFIRTGFGKVEN